MLERGTISQLLLQTQHYTTTNPEPRSLKVFSSRLSYHDYDTRLRGKISGERGDNYLYSVKKALLDFSCAIICLIFAIDILFLVFQFLYPIYTFFHHLSDK